MRSGPAQTRKGKMPRRFRPNPKTGLARTQAEQLACQASLSSVQPLRLSGSPKAAGGSTQGKHYQKNKRRNERRALKKEEEGGGPAGPAHQAQQAQDEDVPFLPVPTQQLLTPGQEAHSQDATNPLMNNGKAPVSQDERQAPPALELRPDTPAPPTTQRPSSSSEVTPRSVNDKAAVSEAKQNDEGKAAAAVQPVQKPADSEAQATVQANSTDTATRDPLASYPILDRFDWAEDEDDNPAPTLSAEVITEQLKSRTRATDSKPRPANRQELTGARKAARPAVTMPLSARPPRPPTRQENAPPAPPKPSMPVRARGTGNVVSKPATAPAATVLGLAVIRDKAALADCVTNSPQPAKEAHNAPSTDDDMGFYDTFCSMGREDDDCMYQDAVPASVKPARTRQGKCTSNSDSKTSLTPPSPFTVYAVGVFGDKTAHMGSVTEGSDEWCVLDRAVDSLIGSTVCDSLFSETDVCDSVLSSVTPSCEQEVFTPPCSDDDTCSRTSSHSGLATPCTWYGELESACSSMRQSAPGTPAACDMCDAPISPCDITSAGKSSEQAVFVPSTPTPHSTPTANSTSTPNSSSSNIGSSSSASTHTTHPPHRTPANPYSRIRYGRSVPQPATPTTPQHTTTPPSMPLPTYRVQLKPGQSRVLYPHFVQYPATQPTMQPVQCIVWGPRLDGMSAQQAQGVYGFTPTQTHEARGGACVGTWCEGSQQGMWGQSGAWGAPFLPMHQG